MDSTSVSQVAQTIGSVLDELGARFGATGSHLWEQMVRYQVATDIATFVAFSCFTALLWWMVRFFWKHDEDYNFDGIGLACVLGFVAILCTGVSVVALVYAVGALVAPEAATLKGLLP